jgi:hypothetical protein
MLGHRTTIVSVICLIACVAGVACKRDQRRATQLGAELSLPLPPKTKVLGVQHERGIDDIITVKLEMATSDWHQLLSAAPFREEDMTPDDRAYLGPDKDWWDPGQAKGLKAIQVVLPGPRALNVGVAPGGEGVILYVVNHSM